MSTQDDQAALPLRSHTILGVCEAIGEDFGFNPVWLRVPLAVTVLFSPTWAVVGYFTLGLVVLASRLLFPKPRTETSLAETPAPVEARADNEQRELAEAA